MNKKLLVSLLVGVAAAVATDMAAFGATLALTPSKDNTLFETADGSTSNGAGPTIFVGRTAGGSARRGLIQFDLGSVPAGSQITGATLTMTVTNVPGGGGSPNPVSLHTLTASWGEGTSSSSGGGGLAAPNDATWLHRFFSSSLWSTPGGDFSADSLASTTLTSAGAYAWSSSALTAAVQQWYAAPTTNFGLILVGDEAEFQTARGLASRESTTGRPTLTLTFSPIPEPAALAPAVAAAALLTRRRR